MMNKLQDSQKFVLTMFIYILFKTMYENRGSGDAEIIAKLRGIAKLIDEKHTEFFGQPLYGTYDFIGELIYNTDQWKILFRKVTGIDVDTSDALERGDINFDE